jgi:hypothetical protein
MSGWYAATSPGAHIESHTTTSCRPPHPDECALCQFPSRAAAPSDSPDLSVIAQQVRPASPALSAVYSARDLADATEARAPPARAWSRPRARLGPVEFAYEGGGIAKAGTVTLYVDGEKTGEGRVEHTEPFVFGEETCDVGAESGSPVTSDHGSNGGSHFSGKVNCVEFDAGIAGDDQNHLISAEERLRVAMARQ